ncbi:MAG: membrane protein insertion efficiency factor YidD [Deltaproteobacteria bacterium]|nr:membrane protein insertion efficiency factor YidD [Deltaproteobacteria bacterium]MBW2137715.1 membrane protein insertion efficiency factor YidD [Deltaproteobacteria bacterium]
MNARRSASIFFLVFGVAALFWLPYGGPFSYHARAIASEDTPATQAGDSAPKRSGPNFAAAIASFYRDHISPVDGSSCPSYPSCSSYSIEAFKKHGFFVGWMMTVDRLIHEGKDEQKVSSVVYQGGKWRIYDPVENNDFWWYPGDDKHQDNR